MKIIDKLTDNAKQNLILIGENGEIIPFYIEYLSTQLGWMFNIAYADYRLNGALLQNSANCLRNYKNFLPFGLACISSTGAEPQNIDDFTSGRIKLYLLNSFDVETIEAGVFV